MSQCGVKKQPWGGFLQLYFRADAVNGLSKQTQRKAGEEERKKEIERTRLEKVKYKR